VSIQIYSYINRVKQGTYFQGFERSLFSVECAAVNNPKIMIQISLEVPAEGNNSGAFNM
jgi:hypothetical protein